MGVHQGEESFNSFAIGFTPLDSAIVVTEASMRCFTRSELQGMIAHEFSHIINTDALLNTRFIPFAHSFLFISSIGWALVLFLPIVLLPLTVAILFHEIQAAPILFFSSLIIASCFTAILGKIVVLILQAMHSRQREWLADAASIQFTRNPSGLRGALEKVDRNIVKEIRRFKKLAIFEHMFFVSGHTSFLNELISSHPPLVDRIKALGQTDYISPREKAIFRSTKMTDDVFEDHDIQAQMEIFKASHSGGRAEKQMAVSMSMALDQSGRISAEGLVTARKLFHSVQTKFGSHLQSDDGILSLAFALAVRLGSKEGDKRSIMSESSGVSKGAMLTDEFVALLDDFTVKDCLSLVPVVSHKMNNWSSSAKKKFMLGLLSLTKRDYNINCNEMCLIILFGSELLDNKELLVLCSSEQSSPLRDISFLLAFVCYAGHPGKEILTRQAYSSAMSKLGLEKQTPPDPSNIKPEMLLNAIAHIRAAKGNAKKGIIDAFLSAVLADDAVRQDEYNLLRSICLCVDVPVPIEPSIIGP